MPSPVPRAASRLLLDVFQAASQPRAICHCVRIDSVYRKKVASTRGYATTTVPPTQSAATEVENGAPPRWARTPPSMTAPVRVRTGYRGGRHEVNKDPQKLDEVYENLLGPGGHKLLSEETKWLAVTHKSFDHGRRGFNDRLAFLGKRIVELQTSLTMLSIKDTASSKASNPDPHGRQPFEHPALEGIERLAEPSRSWVTYHKQVARVAEDYGVPAVPKSPAASGADMVHAQAIFAIIGALALEKGSAVANEVVRERILGPLLQSAR
ncbi:hypothetical protein DV735_g1390, partial [Chaetothyriales sp. CBS 134920]